MQQIGIKDEDFIRGSVPMTKQEIRMLALCKAKLRNTDVVIDIGAGTGSISIEAALLAPQGKVYAIEKEAEGIELIKKNAEKFNVQNIKLVHGIAPDALEGLERADVIFIGGSGGFLEQIMLNKDKYLKTGGRIVLMAVTVETLSKALFIAKQLKNYRCDAVGVQITRLRTAGNYNMFQSLNQVYIIVLEQLTDETEEI